MSNKDYPRWVCSSCAKKAQSDPHQISSFMTWHLGICDVCKKYEALTEPRDFGYPEFKGYKK